MSTKNVELQLRKNEIKRDKRRKKEKTRNKLNFSKKCVDKSSHLGYNVQVNKNDKFWRKT